MAETKIKVRIRDSKPVPLPSIEEIAKMDEAREKALQSLKISSDGLVRCQGCDNWLKMLAG